METQPAWVQQQIRAFTAWVNSYLFQRDMMVSDIVADLSDGLVLINLIQLLDESASASASPSFPSYHRQPKTVFQKTENIEQVLNLLRSHGQPLVGITAQTIADGGNLKAVLGLVWLLILRYDINDEQHRSIARQREQQPLTDAAPAPAAAGAATGSAKDRLLRWVDETVRQQAALAGSAPIPVTSFSALSDGRVFAHLVNRLQPGTIDVAALPASDHRASLTTVFQVADQSLGIPVVLTAEELEGGGEQVDSQSLLTLLSFYKNWRPELLKRREAAKGGVETAKAALLSADIVSPRHGPSLSIGSGKALDSATQLELAEAKQRIAALTTTIVDLQRLLGSKGKSEDEQKRPQQQQQSTAGTQTVDATAASSSSSNGSSEVAALQAELQAASRRQEEEKLQYERAIDKLEAEQRTAQSASAASDSSALRQQLQALESAMATQLQTAKASQQRQEEAEAALTELRRTAQSSASQAETLSAHVKRVEEERAKAIADGVEAVRVELAAAQTQLKANAAKQEEVQRKAAEAEQAAVSLHQQVEQLQKQKEEEKLQYERKLSKYEKTEGSQAAQQQQAAAEQGRQLQQLQDSLSTALKTAKDSQTRQQEQARQLSDLQRSSAASAERAARLETQMQQLEADKAAAVRQVQQLQQELSGSSQALKDQGKRIEAVSVVAAAQTAAPVSSSSSSSSSSAADAEAVRKQRDALQAQVKQLQARVTGLQASTSSVAVAQQLEEKEQQIQTLQQQLEELRQHRTASSAAPAASATPETAAAGEGESGIVSQLRARHAFDLQQLAKEKDSRIASMSERIRQLEASAKSVKASDKEREEEKDRWQRRLQELEEELKRAKDGVRKDLQQRDQTVAELKQAEEIRRKEEEELRQRLEEARLTISQQRKEVTEAAAVRKERADMERRLGQERTKARELQARLEQVKRNREEHEEKQREEDGKAGKQQRSLSQRTSRKTSRATSPTPASHARSFSQQTTSAEAMGSSIEDEKGLPSVSGTATTDEEDEGSAAPAAAAAGKGKKGKKGKQAARDGSNYLISVNSQSASRAESPSGSRGRQSAAASQQHSASSSTSSGSSDRTQHGRLHLILSGVRCADASSVCCVAAVDRSGLLDKHSERSDGSVSGVSTSSSVSPASTVRDLRWVVLLIVAMLVWRLASPNTLREALQL